MRFLTLFWGGWDILTIVLSSPSSFVSDLVLLLLGWSVPLPHHLGLSALLPGVSLPSVPCTSARGRFLGPGARPADDVSQRVVVGPPCGDHLAASLLTHISHMRAASRFLARLSVRVPCV